MKKDEDFNRAVGLRIRRIRESYNMTRDEFSEKCDISTSFLASVELGKKGVSTRVLFKICTATNVSADYFVCGNKDGFESDMLIEPVNLMPKCARDAGLRIFREYVGMVSRLTRQYGRCDKAEEPDML